ncbi:MAG: hypothetical protein ACO3UM_11750, partial [Planctomycetota bacterium]
MRLALAGHAHGNERRPCHLTTHGCRTAIEPLGVVTTGRRRAELSHRQRLAPLARNAAHRAELDLDPLELAVRRVEDRVRLLTLFSRAATPELVAQLQREAEALLDPVGLGLGPVVRPDVDAQRVAVDHRADDPVGGQLPRRRADPLMMERRPRETVRIDRIETSRLDGAVLVGERPLLADPPPAVVRGCERGVHAAHDPAFRVMDDIPVVPGLEGRRAGPGRVRRLPRSRRGAGLGSADDLRDLRGREPDD